VVRDLESGLGWGKARGRGGYVGSLTGGGVAAVGAEREGGGGGLAAGEVEGQREAGRSGSSGDAR
jgi:hypothetical protein